MARFVGVKQNHICVVSSAPFGDNGIEVPLELDHLTNEQLITDCIVKQNKIIYKYNKKPFSEMKIAFVGNWKMRCGIATYSENLWPEISKHAGDFKLFIEKNDISTGDVHQIGDQIISDSKVVVCWKRGESLGTLIKELKEYDPDVVFIQHEFGLFPNAGYWLSMMNQLYDYRVIITMHSVFYHRDKTIVEAAMPEIVVHLDGAKKALKEHKGISGKVHVIPHGCTPCTSKERLWNFYKSEHTFIQAGFGFKYKNFESSIIATSILKQKYPDVFFTAIFSESPSNIAGHQIYYNELMELIDSLNVQENVAIIRGFQSDNTLDSYFRTNKVAVFPYITQPGHEVFGASGAARLAMATYMPIITSSMPHFSDLPTIKADNPEDIAKELDALFSNKQVVDNQLLKQENFLLENNWENIARKYIKLFED